MMDRKKLVEALCAPDFNGRDILLVEAVLTAMPDASSSQLAFAIAAAFDADIDRDVSAAEQLAARDTTHLSNEGNPVVSLFCSDLEVAELPTHPTVGDFDAAAAERGLGAIGARAAEIKAAIMASIA